ncbi:unnamed protein product [Rhizophagus irregularis]|nr:unnamed protein product [Rhizophagus irregularis]
MDISSLLLTESEEQSVNLTSSWNFETTPEIPQLPADIIYQILRNFQYCRSSLCKFLQINQTWCHISLIFLWNCPFSVSLKAKNSVLLIRTLLSFLSEQEKSELKLNLTCYESNISKNSSTYNYLDYIRVFDLKHFRLSILHWISYLRNNNDDGFFSDSLIVELNKIYKDIPINYSTVNLASEIISNMLFRKCGNNGLQHLVIEYDDIITSNYVISKNIIYLNNDLPKLVNFDFHYKLEGNFDKNLLIDRIVEMFEIMTKSVKNLRWLEANIEHEEHRLPKIGKALVEFIEEQNNLEVLGINEFWMYEESEIYRRICKSQQKSLKHVRFYGMCNFKELIKGLSECKNLITLELLRISKYDSNIIPMNDELESKGLNNENSESTIYTQDYWNKIAKSIPDSVFHLGIDFKIEKNMLDMFLKEFVVQYAKKNNNLLKELRFLWDPKDFGFISHSNLEDAKKFIKIIGKVEPINKPFYDIKRVKLLNLII